LVKWTSIPSTSATWEDLYVIKQKFWESIVWGQAISGDGGGVMHPEAVTPTRKAGSE
jgi:hypothetical protein